MLPEAAGRGQHFQVRGHSFSLYGPDPKPVNNLFIFFQALKRKKTPTEKNSRKRYCDRGQR